MSVMSRSNKMKVCAAGVALVTLVAVALEMIIVGNFGRDGAEAATDASVNFSMSSTGCDSSGSPSATCNVASGATFTVALNLTALPSNGNYDAYDGSINYTSGLTVVAASLHQSGAGNWTDCAFAAHNFDTAGLAYTGCSIGAGAASSTYTGALLHLDFSCGASPSTETLTLAHGDGTTDTVDAFFNPYSEAADETLTISCGGGGGTPTATPTPCEPNCPTPTNTPVRPTPTSTPAGVCGDVNGNGDTNSLDAFFVLQYTAGLIPSLPHPENGDLNHDGLIDSRDATIILQISAGLYSC